MDNNVFAKKTVKSNPDVLSNHSKNEDKHNKAYDKRSISYKNDVWRGVLTEKFDKPIERAEDFTVHYERPDFNEMNCKFRDEDRKREEEARLTEEKIKRIEAEKLESINKLREEMGGETVAVATDFEHLKIEQESSNVVLKEKKDKYNELLSSIDDLF
jgi:hypothetical protein